MSSKPVDEDKAEKTRLAQNQCTPRSGCRSGYNSVRETKTYSTAGCGASYNTVKPFSLIAGGVAIFAPRLIQDHNLAPAFYAVEYLQRRASSLAGVVFIGMNGVACKRL